MVDRADHVVDADPAHVLPAISESAANAGAEGREHLSQRSPGGSEHQPGPQLHHPDAGALRWHRRRLPGVTHPLDKHCPGPGSQRGFFREDLITPVAIDANRAGGYQHSRPVCKSTDGFCDQGRPLDAAIQDPPPAFIGPPAAGNRFTREMDYGVQALERHAVESAAGGVPEDIVRFPPCADHPPDAVTTGCQERNEASSYQSGGAGHPDGQRPAAAIALAPG